MALYESDACFASQPGQFIKTEAFKRLPGYISVQLHRGIGGSGTFVNYSVWESMTEFKKTFSNEEVKAILTKVPPKYSCISTPLH